MAFTTELVAPADRYQTVTQTINADSGSVALPAGEWLCTLTGTVRLSAVSQQWIALDGQTAVADKVESTDINYPDYAALGVVLPSVEGGRNIAVSSSGRSGALIFHAACIG